MIITEYEVVNETPIIHVFGRDKEGNRTHIKDSEFRPYFYCLQHESFKFASDNRVVKVENVDTPDIYGRKVSKIVCKIPKYVPELKNMVAESFEADVLYPIRYSIEKFDEIEGVPLSVIYLDIETNSEKAIPDSTIAQDEITCLSCFNNMNKKNITFIWRPDFQYQVKKNPTSFELEDGTIYEYEDVTVYFNNERDMLLKFLDYVQDIDPDMFTGWNVEQFDLTYLINRMNNMAIDYSRLSPMNVAFADNNYRQVTMKGRIVFDMLPAYKKLNFSEMVSYKLDNVAYKELGEKKLKFHGSCATLWRDDPEKLIEYNKKDVMLVYRIQKKKKIIESFDEVRRMSKVAFNDVFMNSRVADSFVLGYCKGRYVLPTKKKSQKEKYGGAVVLTPKKGVHEWVSVFDFKSLYPKIISCLNSSPETITEKGEDTVNLRIPYLDDVLIEKDITNKSQIARLNDEFAKYFEISWDIENQKFIDEPPINIGKYIKYKDVHFRQDEKGFIPSILEYLFDQRILMQQERDKYDYNDPEYKRLEGKQYAFKVLMNSFYGVLGNEGFRLYRPEIAASITFIGRNAILWSKKIAKQHDYDILYGDTDSVFIPLKASEPSDEELTNIKEESEKISQFLQESYDTLTGFFNMKENHLKIEFEKTYKKIFSGGAKKRYAGCLAYYKGKVVDKLQVVGFEVVRSDQSQVAKSTQENVFKMLLKDNKEKKEVMSYLKKVISDIKANKYNYEELGIPTPLKKPVNEYMTNTPVVRGVVYSNKELGLDIRSGEKFLLLYVKNNPKTDVIAIRGNEEVPKGTMIDYEKHIEEAVSQKMEKIFESLKWNMSELAGQKSLLDI
ncbi:MAG: DNA polymerase domain-containing protein [bacterium]